MEKKIKKCYNIYNQMVCQGMQKTNKKQINKAWKRAPRDKELKPWAGKHVDKQHTMSRCFPLGTCQQSVCWAEAQVRIPAAVTPWEG